MVLIVGLPYYRFYPADWLGDTRIQAMTLEEEGAYHRLCAQMWQLGQDCTLPDDDALLARLLRVTPEKWAELRRTLIDGPMAVFQRTPDGRLTNKRLREEWDKAVSKQRQAREAAASRWQSDSDADAPTDAYADAPADGNAGTMPYSDAHIPRISNTQNSRTQYPKPQKQEGEKAPSRPPAGDAPPVPAQAIVDAWNDTCGDVLPKVRALTDKRRKMVRARCRELAGVFGEEVYDPAWWRAVFQRIRASPFLCGKNDRKWHARFDWLFERRDAIVKLVEGQYDDRERPEFDFSDIPEGQARIVDIRALLDGEAVSG